jgi:sec-independent protein translocase protein TatB
MLKKARRMAGDFQGQMDDLVKEANLQEVRDGIAEIRGGFNVRQQLGRMIDPDNTIKSAFSDPLAATPIAAGRPLGPASEPVESVAVGQFPEYTIARPEDLEPAMAEEFRKPAFIPPGISLTDQRPAFIPPGIRR